MGIKSDYSGQYSSKKDELIICEGDKTSIISLMLKGKIDVYLSSFQSESTSSQPLLENSCKLFLLDQNTFLGVNDIINSGQHSFTLKAAEDCSLFCFPADSIKGIRNIISTQKDYSTYIVSSLATLIDLSFNAYQRLLPICENVNRLAENISLYYWAVKDKYYFQYSPNIDTLDSYQQAYEELKNSGCSFFPVNPDLLSIKIGSDPVSESKDSLDTQAIEYFSSLLNVPLEQRKGFFNNDSFVCEFHIQKGSELLDTLIRETKSLLSDLFDNIDYLYTSPKNLLATYGRIVIDSKEDKEAALTIFNILEHCSDILIRSINELQSRFDSLKTINIAEISDFVGNIESKAAISSSSSNSISAGAELPQELENSLESIIQYCGCPHDTFDSFNKRLSQFRALKDKTSNDSETRDLRTSLASDFFAIYEEAFKRTQKDNYCPKLISMFLNFGYMDERLLTKEQTITLYRLCDKEYPETKYSIYSAKEWMASIHQNRKDASINDFGQDYFDVFRDMKKRKMVTDQDKAAYEKDFDAKLSFEINNMMKTNQKVCHGHISTYFPILHKDIITRDLEKAVVTPSKIQQAIDNILATDFSVFYREIWYKNDAKGIEKEPIMKEVLPDIILIPTFGSRPSMWQEITGRSRNTPGRFILPAFTDENIDDMVLKLIGAFRWELCRTMMGVAWNDITEKSLTSEYTDYIQFYKKNHDLTEDAKDKIKIQIQKNRNMMKDIFTSDYDTWINFESKGILRLNKIARSILFRYCPLPKEIRTNLAKQPAFADLAMQLNASRAKTAKSLAGKYTKMFKDGPVDQDMELNLIFYRDL